MTPRARFALAAATVAWSVSAGPAAAERIVSSLSTHRVLITSSFTGAELVLFGSVERDATPAPQRSGYDVVVTVTGPKQTMVVRRKDRVLGIWINVDSRTFVNVPAYLAVLANQPIEAIASAEIARRLQLGLKNFVLPQQIGPDIADVVRDDPFRSNFVRLRTDHKLYLEQTNGVTFLTPLLFRANIPLPAGVPFGNYHVDVRLFADGAMITRASSAFELVKIGFEQFVADAAHSHSLLYGLATALMALLTGWLASVMFRRE